MIRVCHQARRWPMLQRVWPQASSPGRKRCFLQVQSLVFHAAIQSRGSGPGGATDEQRDFRWDAARLWAGQDRGTTAMPATRQLRELEASKLYNFRSCLISTCFLQKPNEIRKSAVKQSAVWFSLRVSYLRFHAPSVSQCCCVWRVLLLFLVKSLSRNLYSVFLVSMCKPAPFCNKNDACPMSAAEAITFFIGGAEGLPTIPASWPRGPWNRRRESKYFSFWWTG